MFDDPTGDDGEIFDSSPVWPASADVMACLAGLFVLLFVSALVFQLDLLTRLDDQKDQLVQEQKARAAENARLVALETALAGPLAKGRITLEGAKIGIQGNLLFAPASPDLSDDGKGLILDLALPLATYAEQTHTLLMVSGFTDNLPVNPGGRYVDNWELSQARAMTVTRVLMDAGFPQAKLLAAGFGDNYPVASNETEEGRSLNRRVEIAPVPVPRTLAARAEAKKENSNLNSADENSRLGQENVPLPSTEAGAETAKKAFQEAMDIAQKKQSQQGAERSTKHDAVVKSDAANATSFKSDAGVFP